MAASGGHGVIRFDGDNQVWPPVAVTNIPNYRIRRILVDTPGVSTYTLRLGGATGTIIWSATFPGGGSGMPACFDVCSAHSAGQRLFWDDSAGAGGVGYLYVE